ncbi:NUDIX hydrolase [Deinococcus radiopugnans]|uniref:8-oxo-dGTP pyrophosphatase MutT (NUDIX family) n=1 Tax=Deinococcus radiopugnans ATCC 19172 TaxID=585398 RepID=A0ABR6NT34_9DEIO|nr:NUDIX hydrolase [Deinococcus radiopugnans]MBB6017211.1 8-oxo-dGTP pyrophosphatase MutT (NUDIX family) [Deinococcus radiopugnans ATCC 19172]
MTAPPFLNLSPGEDRIGRACAWIEHEGRVLMSARDAWGWTLPGGGIHPGETPQQAAVREAWEECRAHCEVIGEAVRLSEGADCYPMRLLGLESSPEGRPVLWVRPESVWWACDPQLCQVLAAQGRSIPSPAFRAGLQTVRRITFQTQAAFRRSSRMTA